MLHGQISLGSRTPDITAATPHQTTLADHAKQQAAHQTCADVGENQPKPGSGKALYGRVLSANQLGH